MRLAQFPFIVSLLATLILSFSTLALANEPSLHEVYQKIQAGQLAQADVMMKEVLQNHPNSAKAHYIMAELRLKEGRLEQARAELARAEKLAPGLPFAQVDSVQKLRTQLASGSKVSGANLAGNAAAPNSIF
ncbi:MAG: tetratricopeptide repeat protein, partial [Burkholderiales bacterium]|nr:tetratricopeptide repeat protein [Burkholderiales bacterium]